MNRLLAEKGGFDELLIDREEASVMLGHGKKTLALLLGEKQIGI